jgi:hypothetical protein
MSTEVELPIATPTPAPVVAPASGISRAEWLQLARWTRWLS